MSNWKQQNMQAKAALLTCLETLAGRGVVWITCDSEAHAADTLTWLQGQFLPGQHPYGYSPFSTARPMLVAMLDEWKTFAVDGVDPAPILHWRGLGFYTEEVFTQPMPGYYEELNLAAVLPGAGLPFTTVIWTDSKTRQLIQAGAPAFAAAITLHIHLDHPPVNISRELEVMAEEFDQLDEAAAFALATYQTVVLERLLQDVKEPKLARQVMEYAAKLSVVIEQYDDAISLLDECMRMPLPLTPVKKAEYLYNMGVCHNHLGDFAKATHALKAALATHLQVKDEAKQVLCLTTLGAVALNESKPQAAAAYLEEALEIALGIEDFGAPTLQVFLHLGKVWEVIEDYPAALATYDLFYEEELHLEYPEGDVEVTLAKAFLLEKMGEDVAMKEALEAAYVRLRIEPEEWLPGSQSVLHLFGCQLHAGGEMARAIDVLLEAVLVALQARDFDLVMQSYTMISMSYISLGMEEASIRYYLRGLKWMNEKDEAAKEQMALLHKELVEAWGKERVAARTEEILPQLYGDEAGSGAEPVTAGH